MLNETVDGYTVSYTIVLNPLTGTYTCQRKHLLRQNHRICSYNTGAGRWRPTLLPSRFGLVLFAGILLAGKQHRQLAEN